MRISIVSFFAYRSRRDAYLNDQSEIMATMRNLLQRLMIDGEATYASSSIVLPTTSSK
jgi:hypothetical protein